MNSARFALTGGLVAAGLILSACVTLLPEEKPAQLYRFGYDPAAIVPDTKAAKPKNLINPLLPAESEAFEVADPDRFQVYLSGIEFPTEASSDRLMTVEGSEVSFIAHARWAAPAPDMFRDAVSEGFDRSGGQIHLSSQIRGASTYRLEMKVRRFEVVYSRKKPVVSVGLDASITRVNDRKLIAKRYITTDVGVQKSDVSLIVSAFEKATSQVVYALVKFTEETAVQTEAEAGKPDAAPESDKATPEPKAAK
jgi:cholesterol transport system auxiliary component